MYTASKVGGVSWRSVLALPTWPSQVICEYAPARIQVFSLYLVLNCSCSCNRTCNCSPSCSNVHIHTQTQTTYHKCILKCTYTIFTFDMSSTNEMHKNVLSALALSYQHTHTYIIYYYYYYNYYLYIINNFWSKFEMLICIYSIYFLCFLSRVNAILFSMLLKTVCVTELHIYTHTDRHKCIYNLCNCDCMHSIYFFLHSLLVRLL